MERIHNIHPGIVAEWLSLIDPQSANDRDYENKIAAIIRSQADMLLNSNMTEIRAKHWVLTKHRTENNTTIEFTLIAYSARSEIIETNEKEFQEQKIQLLKENLRSALEAEDYMKAAEVRDLLRSLEESGRSAA